MTQVELSGCGVGSGSAGWGVGWTGDAALDLGRTTIGDCETVGNDGDMDAETDGTGEGTAVWPGMGVSVAGCSSLHADRTTPNTTAATRTSPAENRRR